MVGRLPESWIPSEHILDLRARVRLRHTLGEQRSECQQRIQAVLYHHGCPARRRLMIADGREWLHSRPLPESAREQVTVALQMIDALQAQIAPLEAELRAYARKQAGCRALMAHYGIGELTAVTILAEPGDCGRFSSSRHAVRFAGMDVTVHESNQRTRRSGPAGEIRERERRLASVLTGRPRLPSNGCRGATWARLWATTHGLRYVMLDDDGEVGLLLFYIPNGRWLSS
jgi:transposase